MTFIPHGYCLGWNPSLLWTLVTSDLVIGVSYYSIPVALLTFLRRHRDPAFDWVLALFALFIFACGMTHFIDILNIWNPAYGYEAVTKAITAASSAATAVVLWPLVPKAAALLTEREDSRRALEEANKRQNESMRLLAERTAQVEESERRFRLTLENAPIGLAIVGLDGRFLTVNQVLCNMLGYAADELLATGTQQLTLPEDWAHELGLIEDLLTGRRESYRCEKRYRHKNGGETYVQIDRTVLRDDLGQPIHFITQVQDITERQQLEQIRHRLVVEAAPNAMIMVDGEGRITLVNAQTEKLFGYSSAELIGQRIEILVPPRVVAQHPKLRESYFHQSKSRPMGMGRDLYGITKDGREVPVEIGLNPIESAEGTLVLAAIIDISERKRAESVLQEMNRSLEQQVRETRLAMDQLRNAQDQLVQSEKLASLGALVAGVAHEINTPIGIGVTAASFLRSQASDISTQFAESRLRRSDLEHFIDVAGQSTVMILNNLQRAADLIQSFKQVAVDQSSDQRRRFELASYINEILLSMAPALKKTRHAVKVNCPSDLQMDSYPGALAQVLTNLINNSLLHAFPPDGAGHIRIDVERTGDSVMMHYRDDGAGISPENLPRVFDPFFTTRRGAGGSGLGLNIVHNLVFKALGGRITVSSTPGQGVDFAITFPRIAPSEAATAAMSPALA